MPVWKMSVFVNIWARLVNLLIFVHVYGTVYLPTYLPTYLPKILSKSINSMLKVIARYVYIMYTHMQTKILYVYM